MTRRGFTLVEMLVAVALIALLLSILVPMLGRSKDGARLAVCQSNLHQLLGAADHFSLDHQGRLLEYRAASSEPAGTRWWFGFEPAGGLAVDRPLEHDLGPLGPYLAGIGERLQCGAFAYGDVNHIRKFARPAASYGYNWRLSGMKKLGAFEMPDEVVRPQTRARYRSRMSEVFIFADSVFFEPHPNPQAFFEGYYIAWQSNVAALSGYAHFRHFERANVAYLDGHVSAVALVGASAKSAGGAKAGNIEGPAGGPGAYGD